MKVLVDENIGMPLVKALSKILLFHSSKPSFKSLLEFFAVGTLDPDWIKEISNDGWIVITSDRGSKSGGNKLPILCKQHKVTHILISGKLHNSPQFEKIKAIINCWDDIVVTNKAPKGSRYTLRYTSARSYKLEKR